MRMLLWLTFYAKRGPADDADADEKGKPEGPADDADAVPTPAGRPAPF